jgi:DNA mismatch endonuclease, patch repair protein
MDIWTKKKRSAVMSNIPSKNTKPELLIRSLLLHEGFRFRVHYKKLPGYPDIVLSKYKTVIFVNGCFWHQHKDWKEGRIPSSNREYWRDKLVRNVSRMRRLPAF